ncbi:hypothetical protein [Bergeyella zoohelcum]|uniref:Uncharacterized protein n=1 Tax=Bergeyella zoohelcum TaxID=1015 RepID=A0A7Z9CG81_9FLAO|nr:hypothetical protein [Bergeyella zoohelcum]VDH03081.1 Uncharacterised protein [Bergeyella zoohelcum]VDH03082.1 Uncharacterised protein [Bergeyella zoohelcum]
MWCKPCTSWEIKNSSRKNKNPCGVNHAQAGKLKILYRKNKNPCGVNHAQAGKLKIHLGKTKIHVV